jgi:hypothetical protein
MATRKAFTVRLIEPRMARLTAYCVTRQKTTGNQCSYSQAIQELIDAIPAKKLDEETMRNLSARNG